VSAWVKLADANPGTPTPDLATGNRTAVSQHGTWVGAFLLGYKNVAGTPRWSLGMKHVDSDDGPWVDAVSSNPVTTADVGRWTQLVGVFDASTATVKLYVNGSLAGSVSRPVAGWDAGGPLTIGAARWSPVGGSPIQTDYWPGDIDEVRVYPGVVTDVGRIP
jgi:hypothetical protein